MTEKKENTTIPEAENKERMEQTLQTDWAQEASDELHDYIEEQGIYIRY